MKVLVTGGTGVIGAATVRALLAAAHQVRLFSRHAKEDAAPWRGEIETREGSIGSPLDVAGIAEGCDAVLHIAGIAEERPPEATFARVNVGGTQHIVSEAERAGVRRFVYVSSLGADTGTSAYHASKLQGEQIVRGFQGGGFQGGSWLICRPGNVYGPGDEVISFLLQIVRAAPVAPLIDLGDQPFQPLWADDLGAALAVAVEREDLSSRVLLLAGTEVTSTQDLFSRLSRITGRSPIQVPVPSPLAALGAQVASALGVRVPFDDNKLTMLQEGNVIPPDEVNALTEVLAIRPTPLDEGLAQLANAQPEQLEGTGHLVRRRFTARLEGVTRYPKELFQEFKHRFFELAPEATVRSAGEPVEEQRIETGASLTLDLPLRGHVQVRIVEVTNTSMSLVTLAGHPLAGINTFRFEGIPGHDLRFEVETCDRSATPLDEIAMRTLGLFLKRWTWATLVERTAKAFGSPEPVEITTTEETLRGDDERQALQDMERKIAAQAREVEPDLQEEARAKMAEAAAMKPV
jgi:nucleoside-diphosphate-sugar epimerase